MSANSLQFWQEFSGNTALKGDCMAEMERNIVDIRMAIAQIDTSVGDIEGNTKKIIEYIDNAKKGGAELVIFPEMSISGYPPKDLLFAKEFVEECEEAAAKIMEASKGIAVVVGGVERKDGNLYNSAFVFKDGKKVYTYHKANLPNYDVFDEKRYFALGSDDGIFELFGKKMAVNICEDIWIENGPADMQAKKGANLIINISASPFYSAKPLERQKLMKEHIARGKAPIIYANQVGGQDDLVFDGESYAFNGHGDMIAQGKHFDEDIIIFTLADAPINARMQSAEEEMYEALKLGLRDYVMKNRFNSFDRNGFYSKVVIGLSGGIDSALTSVIAADALSPENVVCVLMPSRYSTDHSVTDALKLAENLGVRHETVSIEPAFTAFNAMLSPLFKGLPFDVTEENIQARARMVVLYAIANKFKCLVLNTSNKSESAVGYGTLYGDISGGLAVIGDVPKTMVYSICSYINKKAGFERIPGHILSKEPSAELKENQKDRDSLPDYAILDNVVRSYVEEIKSPSEIECEALGKKELYGIVRRIDLAEYKRHRGPMSLKVTKRAFGTGRRMPLANGYRYKIRE